MLKPDGTRHKPMTNYVVHAEQIEGPWSDPIDLGIDTAIDPGHAVGEDGKRYLYVSNGTFIPLSDDGLHRAGPDEQLYHGWAFPTDWAVETFALEGPKILRKDGWFYMFSAQGGTAGPPTSHMVVVARSRSIRGPWENCPANPIVHTRSAKEPWWSRGHGTPVEGPDGDWWMLYHGYENGFRTLGRQGLLEPMRWTQDGWPQATGGDLSHPLKKPIARSSALQGAAPSETLGRASLGSRLSFFKPGRDYDGRLRVADNTLWLGAQGKGPIDSSPLVLNTGDHHYELSAELELAAGTTAGLLLFYNEKFFCGIASDGRVLHAYNLGAENAFELRSPAPRGRVHFRLVNEEQVGRFYFSTDGLEWTLYRSFEVAGYNHNIAGGYLSLRPAIFACGEGGAFLHNLQYSAK